VSGLLSFSFFSLLSEPELAFPAAAAAVIRKGKNQHSLVLRVKRLPNFVNV
jgi:hypothetical protein